jgi:probable F420-dependent oxidoreductase
MKFGVLMFATDTSIGVVELARAAEERGMESLFLPEHSHIPVCRNTPFPGGGDLPEEYRRALDPLIGLAAAAAATSTLRVGTGVCLVVQRDPIQLAKEVASLDLISGGRFLFGIGAGWNLEEMADHGTDPSRRFTLLRERVAAMKQIWAHDEAEFHGSLVDFDPMWQWPKPVQRPHPPILLGGHGPRALERVVEYADEWFPTAWRDPTEVVSQPGCK